MTKKIILTLLVFIIALSVFGNIEFAESDIIIKLDGITVSTDTPPFIDANNRTMVPVRFISEALGAAVAWDADARTVTVTKASTAVKLTIDSRQIYVDGVATAMDTAAIIRDGRTFVPVKYIAEALDLNVSWDDVAKTVLLSTVGAPSPSDGTSIAVGAIIKFGNYSWRVLEVRGGKALLLSEQIIEPNMYNLDMSDTTWEKCFLRKSLNDRFLKNFSSEEQGMIAETTIANPGNLWYGTPGGAVTKDKIFLLSLEEADRYFGGSGDYVNSKRKAWGGDGNVIVRDNGWAVSNDHDIERASVLGYGDSWWWLRSPGATSNSAAAVNIGGSINVRGRDANTSHPEMGGVRPALWLNLEKYVYNLADTTDALLQKKLNGSIAASSENLNTLKVGQVLKIDLYEKQSIPYRWTYEISDGDLARHIYDEYNEDADSRPIDGGDSGSRCFYFEALRPGKCTIEMKFGRIDEEDYDDVISYAVVIVLYNPL